MLTALHAMIYSDDPAATRRFLMDVLRWPFVSEGARGDAGVGGAGTGGTDPAEWLIFRSGPSELGVHPTREGDWSAPRHHSLTLTCDDLDATMAELAGRGAQFSGEPRELGFGRAGMMAVPGADDLMLYQPAHATAHDLPSDEPAHDHGHTHHDHSHGERRMPVTDDEWHQHYAAEAIWSGNPNGALVAEVSSLEPGRAVDVGCGGRMGSDSMSHGPCLAARGRWSGPLFTVAHTT